VHLSVNQTYPWVLHLSDEELTVMQAVLRGEDLDDDSEALADHLSHTLDKIRPLAERTRERREKARERVRDRSHSRRSRPDGDQILESMTVDDGNGTNRLKLPT
jgi:hypothetical protein